MAGVSPMAASSLAQQPFPTPSPFTFSTASARSNTRPSIHLCSLILRFLALIFSFVCAFSLATSTPKKQGRAPSSFNEYPELMYCFIVTIFTFIYSAFQLFKRVCDITYRGILIPDKISDYISFILDQLVGYLLLSSSSVAIPAIQHIEHTESLWKATIIAMSMSFVTFFAIATCGLFSGYKLCKRIIW
ncbi:hypothetical protein SO802_033955 [Lithocarpus litseifolius]|uniref:CASP-like protein n=1 Tax=Lithocarpus litseifolius TaxID=425828 RepID=A0AAW2BHS6_9ROSI